MNPNRPPHLPASAPWFRVPNRCRDERGSLLIVAMLIAAVIGISLVSYIKLATNSLTMADRSFYQTSAINLVEVGAEEALYCFNRLDDVASEQQAWSGITNANGTSITWTIASDNSVSTTLPVFSVGTGVTGRVRIYCTRYNPSTDNPKVAVRATITPAQGPAVEKWLEVTLRKRSLWANGMVARNTIVWSGGNASVDSWNSDHDNNPSTPGVAYGSTDGPAHANATVGTPSSTNGAIDVGGGVIRGELLNSGGTILKSSGAVLSNTTTGTGWDTSLISADFDATFPTITVPAPPATDKNIISSSSRPITFSDTLPRTGDVAWNGTYYYEFGTGYNLSAAGSATSVVTVNGNVIFLATNHSGVNVIDLGGQASIQVTATGSLKIYTNGNIEAAGNGMVNSTANPAAMQIYGTNTSVAGQTIRFDGNGSSVSAIYAPNATFELKGNGALNGAVVANTIKINGNGAFHYDEALGSVTTGNPFGIVKWRELQSSTERDEYTGKL
ncbi:MAG: hypothetical protein Q7S40_13225 [Opitutaceae bacterium]|nr:hypothetical protein [Opitutaceae bacterium]